MPLPFVLRVRRGGRSVAGELPLDTEISLFKQLVSCKAVEWRLSLLGWNGDAKFEHVTVVSRTTFASGELQARDAALRETERAMRLTEKLGEGKVRRSNRASAIGRRPVVRRTVARREEKGAPESTTESDSDSTSRSASPSPAASSEASVLAELPGAAAAAAPPPAPAPPPPPPPPQPPVARGPLLERAGRGERSAEHWGPFIISEVWRAGSCIGFGARCARHTNEGEDGRTVCQKQVVFGQSGVEGVELIRRLKRWLLAGFDDDGWGPIARSSHVRLGGPGLRTFATSHGQEGEDLDAMLGRRLQGRLVR